MKLKFSLSGSVKTTEPSDDSIYHSCDTQNLSTLLAFIAQVDFLSEVEEPELRIVVPSKDVKDFLHLWQELIDSGKVKVG